MTTTWAAKVLAEVPRFQTMGGNWLPEADALAAIARMGAGDGLVERLQDAFNACRPMNGSNELDNAAAAISDAIAHIATLTAQNQTWQRNSRETFDAMVAMRNSINEHLPMPSLESDLLQGPENSVFCAAVAEAVVSEVSRLRAKVARLEGTLRKLHHAVCGETGFAACVRLDSGKAYPWPALDDADKATRAALTDGGKDG